MKMLSNEDKITKILNCIDKAFTEQTRPSETKKLAIKIANQIEKRTRLGKGLSVESSSGSSKKLGNLENLKKLSTSYKNLRKRSINLSDKTRPSKSNLTATDQLLNSMRAKGGIAKAIIFINDNRTNKSLGKAPLKSVPTNSEIIKYQEDQGRNFFDLSNSEFKRFEREGSKRLREESLKCFNKK